jgi:hypothetical protein
MGEPMNAARGFEPDPIPANVPETAAVRGDVERGYSKGDDDVLTPVEEAKHGKGLTAGDAGELCTDSGEEPSS